MVSITMTMKVFFLEDLLLLPRGKILKSFDSQKNK